MGLWLVAAMRKGECSDNKQKGRVKTTVFLPQCGSLYIHLSCQVSYKEALIVEIGLKVKQEVFVRIREKSILDILYFIP